MTEKFTGADLANLAREAYSALEEEDENETEIEAVYMRHVEKAISGGSSTASPEPSAEMFRCITRSLDVVISKLFVLYTLIAKQNYMKSNSINHNTQPPL